MLSVFVCTRVYESVSILSMFRFVCAFVYWMRAPHRRKVFFSRFVGLWDFHFLYLRIKSLHSIRISAGVFTDFIFIILFIFGFLTIGLLLAVAQLRLHNNSILMNLPDFFFGSTLMIKIENWI